MHPVARNLIFDIAKACFRISMATGSWIFHWVGNHLLFFFSHRRFPDRTNPTIVDLALFNKLDLKNIALGPFVDKELVKHYVTGIAPEVKVPETYAVLRSAKDLVGFNLPHPYVAKPTHSSGVVVLKPEGGSLSDPEIGRLRSSLDQNYYLAGGEIQYRHLDRKIMVEEFVGQPPSVPPDYKFQFFEGAFQHCYVCRDRYSVPKFLFVNEVGDRFDLEYSSPLVPPAGDFYEGPFELDGRFQEMLEIAEKLSRPFRFCRVDLFPLSDAVCFGEFTFSPGNALYHYEPAEFMALRPRGVE